MTISCVDKTCQQQSASSPFSSSKEEDDEDTNKVVSTVQRILKESDKEPCTINKLKGWCTRNYYSGPTPLDLQYEERGQFGANSFDGTTLYEWNIGGNSEYEILSTLYEMVMAATAYKSKNMTASHTTIALWFYRRTKKLAG